MRRSLRPPCASVVASVALESVAALAQGALAVVLGALARGLGGLQGSASAVSGMTWMSRVWSSLPPSLASAPAGIALAGVVLVLVRGVATVAVTRREALDAARVAADARLHVLSAALGPRRDVSIGEAVTLPAEVEAGARAERSRLRAAIHLLVLAAVIVALDATLAAVVVATLLPFALLLRPIRRALRAAHDRAVNASIELVDASRDVVEHASLWAACGAGETACRRVQALSREGSELAARAAARQSAASASNEVLAAIAVVVLVAFFAPGAAFARPTLVPVLVALVSAYRPIPDLADATAPVSRGRRASEKILGLEPFVASAPRRTFARSALALRRFAVDVGSPVARSGVDLDLPSGSAVAIVGAPGTGKSALLEAIVGVRSARGVARYAGFDLADVPLGARPFSWVPPSPPVLPGTLGENLCPDDPRDVARVALARRFLRELGDEVLLALGDDDLLGPRGHRPSSGEAQRLALARALASPSPVLVLDEPTANLDVEGERRAIDVLRAALRARSLVIVTHRAAPLALADRVIDLGNDGVGATEAERRIA